MKFTCEKSLLLESLTIASRAVSQKALIPALEGILISTEKNDQIKITGFNLEVGIEALVEASVSKPGAVVLNARIFGEIVRKLPDGIISFDCDETYKITILCQKAKFNISGMKASDFPELPAVEQEKSLLLKQYLLKSMIRQTLFAVAQSDSKPVHTGALFDLEDGVLNVVAVDGFRLAKRKELVQSSQTLRFIIPGSTLNEVAKVLSDEEEKEIHLTLSKKHVLFDIGEITIVSRLLEGEFLNYKGAIPVSSSIKTKIATKELMHSVERASLLISEKNRSPLRVKIDEKNLIIDCETAIGKIHDEIEVESNGGPIEIGFNNRYMLDALKNSEAEEVYLKMNTPLTPCVVEPLEGDSFTFLVLPVKLKGTGEKKNE